MSEPRQVIISLQGALEDGEIFEKTPDDHPLPVVLGTNSIFPRVEAELLTMRPGETRSITLEPEEAYGPHHDELVQTLDRSLFTNSIRPEPGMILSLNVDHNGERKKVPATVVRVDDGSVTVDYNHPLAGKTVVYTVTLHEIMN